MKLFKLSKEIQFPAHHYADKNDGILAYGGDLSSERLIFAYKNGIFPWFNEDEPIIWHSPKKRFVLFPNELKVSKSMRKIINSNEFNVTENIDFEQVINKCGNINRANQVGTWITNEMKSAYLKLHHLGFAKSIEVWKEKELVGGFYGIDLGDIFCGESMFSKVSNASKAGFIHFVNKYNTNYKLIDCQVYTDHLASLGAKEIPRDEFLKYLSL